MSQGTAVVASDIPAIREVAGGAARLVPPAMSRPGPTPSRTCSATSRPASAWPRPGAERARRFDVAATIAGIRAVYRELLGR